MFETGFHVSRPTRGRAENPYPYRAVTVSGPPFQAVPVRSQKPLAWSAFARHYLRSLCLMSFPPATEMVQFAGFASCGYGFTAGYPLRGGLPHSEIRGSTGARPSPRLFAACHVLHRLSVPRHPPDALLSSSPTLSPKHALRACREQSTDDRGQTGHRRTGLHNCLLSAVTCSLKPRHKPSLRRCSRIGVSSHTHARSSQTERLDRLHGFTTRFTMSRDQRTEIENDQRADLRPKLAVPTTENLPEAGARAPSVL